MNEIVYRAVNWVFDFMKIVLIIRALLSWLPIPRSHALIGLLYQITEPILGPIRRMIEKSAIGRNVYIDISPIIAYFLIIFIQNIVARILLANMPGF